MTWFIPGNVPSSKNGKQWTGKFLVMSRACREYKKQYFSYYQEFAQDFRQHAVDKPKPLQISFRFIRGSKHAFDYINPLQYVQDLMVEAGWIPDDNADEILPIFIPYEYNKKEPGVKITI
jgi:hypothetical protein